MTDERTYVVGRNGEEINVSGRVWLVPHPIKSVRIDLSEIEGAAPEIQQAAARYIKYLIEHYSSSELKNNWGMLKLICAQASVRSIDVSQHDVPASLLNELKSHLPEHRHYELHYCRKWYNWCCDQAILGFSPEVAFDMNGREFGGNSKGEAVLSADPNEGPLSDLEVAALTSALRAARSQGTLSLTEATALWLCLALGSNAGPLSTLRECDLKILQPEDKDALVYILNMPRHKKRGDAHPRAQFKPRRLNSEIGSLVEALIKENQRVAPIANTNNDGRPLFRRASSRRDLPDHGQLAQYRFHYSGWSINSIVHTAAQKLGVISHRSGESLRLSVRRLRYTFATRLVREGASQRVVAELLDHSDLQSVGVYFDVKSDIVRRLDAATAMTLGPLSQAFMGILIASEKDATRAGDRASRVQLADRKSKTVKPVGNCGNFSFCSLIAPLACYTCIFFQPWVDGPHQQAMDGLIAERKRRMDAGVDPRMVTIFDTTILAIADVIARIRVLRDD